MSCHHFYYHIDRPFIGHIPTEQIEALDLAAQHSHYSDKDMFSFVYIAGFASNCVTLPFIDHNENFRVVREFKHGSLCSNQEPLKGSSGVPRRHWPVSVHYLGVPSRNLTLLGLCVSGPNAHTKLTASLFLGDSFIFIFLCMFFIYGFLENK